MSSIEHARAAVSITVQGKAWYIYGGTPSQWGPNTRANNQLLTLDLTVPTWNVTKPPWTLQPAAPNGIASVFIAGGLSLDQQELIILSGGNLTARFKLPPVGVTLGTWLTPTALSTEFVQSLNLEAATDPETGLIYIPSGYNSLPRKMMVYNPATGATRGVVMPDYFSNLWKHSMAWSPYRKALILYSGAGDNDQVLYDKLVEYSPVGDKWTELIFGGDRPPTIGDGCLVPIYGGRKMVLFGGWTGGMRGGPVGSVYLLDFDSRTWERGADIRPELLRTDHACTTVGDHLIAWGGMTIAAVQLTPVVYNVKTGQWVDQYVFSDSSTSTPSPLLPTTLPPLPGGSQASSDGNGAAIGGGVAAVVVLGAVATLLVLRRRKARKAEKSDSNQDPSHSQPSDFTHRRAPQTNKGRGDMAPPGTTSSLPSPQQYPSPQDPDVPQFGSYVYPPIPPRPQLPGNSRPSSFSSYIPLPAVDLGSPQAGVPMPSTPSSPASFNFTQRSNSPSHGPHAHPGKTELSKQDLIAIMKAEHEKELRWQQRRLEELELDRQIKLQRQAMERLQSEQMAELEALEKQQED